MYLSRLLLLVFFVAMISAVTAGVFAIHVTRVPSSADFNYTVKFAELLEIDTNDTDGDMAAAFETRILRTISVNITHDIGTRSGVRFFPINYLTDFMDFTTAGSIGSHSFIRQNPDEHLRIETNSAAAYVNGARHHMSAPSFIDDNNIYVPLDFILNAFDNISFDEDDYTLVMLRSYDRYLRISAANYLAPIELTAEALLFLSLHGTEPVTFLADISAFERYFEPPISEIDEYLRLINQTNPLPHDFHPADLINVVDTRGDRAVQQLRLYPARALEAMLIEARANGHTNLSVTSGFRDYALQTSIFNTNVNRLVTNYGLGLAEATAQTAFAIAHPGQSEHQSGLAVDVHSLGSAASAFGRTPEGMWLAQNAHHFGFIVRYLEGKEHITGIQYEPWHFRYVGRRHATRIFNMGIVLEEYHEMFLQ